MKQKIFITGGSGGFGFLTVKTLLKNGHQVVATMRGVQGKNNEKAQELERLGARILEMDVTNTASVDAAVQNAVKALGGLDVVINNAGVGVLGVQETFTPEDMQRLFDINVFGVQRVNRAVLPYLREKKAGTIIHISSLLGRMTVPFYGPYNASKWALEALAENYRTELSQFGIESLIVEPGGYPTTFIDNLMRPSDHSRDTSLEGLPQFAEGFLENFEKALASNPAQDPQNVANAILGLIESPRGSRQFRTVVDKMGMGTHIEPYNQQLAQITSGVYGAFGIGHLLELKKSEA